MTVMERLANSVVVPVVVLDKAEDAVPTAKAMAAGGVDTMEITFRTACAPEAIKAVAENCPDVLVGAGTVKNAAGIYGMFAILSIWIGPFLHIGAHYLLLKATAAVCGVFGSKRITALIGDFSVAMGLLLAMTGTVCFLILVSTVCFMKGGS